MGKTATRPRARMIGGRRRFALMVPGLMVCGLALAGCAHRDPIDTPVGWWHQLQGGAIAQQRPPPPGIDGPYPKIGTTPAHAPVVASIDLRRSVTTNLLRQRNIANRLDANDPIPIALAAPVRPPAVPTLPAASGGSSAQLDAAQAQPSVPAAPGAAPGKAAPGKAPPVQAPTIQPGDVDAEPELALPAVQVQAPDASGVAVTLPPIPGAPPPSPRLPGLTVTTSEPTLGLPASSRRPDYAVGPVEGTAIGFAPGTDTMLSGQTGALHAVAVRRGSGAIFVHGYGDAAASDPDTQSQALSVATLRARTVAEALRAEGIPDGSIRLRAEAFGRGASVSLVQ